MNSQYKGRTKAEDNLYTAGLCIILAVIVLFIWKRLMFPDVIVSKVMRPCVLHMLTGYYCPGCGGTRSVEALFRGKFLVCAGDYPLTAYAAVMFVWFMVSQTVERLSKGKLNIGLQWRNSYLWIALGILIVHFIVINIIYIVTGADPFLS